MQKSQEDRQGDRCGVGGRADTEVEGKNLRITTPNTLWRRLRTSK
jgi:hypothetical protein